MGKRKQILEPEHLQNRVADACYKQGKDQAYAVFASSINALYDMLKDLSNTQPVNEAQRQVIETYMDEVRRREPFTDILGIANTELSPYKPSDQASSPFIPPAITALMVGSKYLDVHGLKSIIDRNCGTGTFMLALMHALLSKRPKEDVTEWKFTAYDADLLNARICAVQFMINTAVHNVAPGQLLITHRPVDVEDREQLVLNMSFSELSQQFEIFNSSLSSAGSAQALLFG